VTALVSLCVLTAALLIAGCTSPTTTNTSGTATATNTSGTATTVYPSLTPSTLNGQLAKNTSILENFTIVPDSTPPTYTATAQDNGTLHSITLILAASPTEAQGQFEAQKASYADYAAQPNATVTANTSTHWAVTTATNGVSVWVGAPRTAGPFGITLDAPYVVVSMDTKPPTR
jgi:hypothetical protein